MKKYVYLMVSILILTISKAQTSEVLESDKIKSMFKIEVICKDEQEQEKTYNKLIEQNYECRLLTL